ncbi:MAG: hypothetical protein PHN38_00025 [Sulfurospirillaceae bacterium]|nr:hypothetical protein [Sulfurospirillaceae bacterium]
MKTLKTILIAGLITISSVSNAHAIGDNERAALWGAGALLLAPTLINNMGNLFSTGATRTYETNTVTYVEPSRNVYYEPRVVVREEPVYIREKVIIVDDHRPYYKWDRRHPSHPRVIHRSDYYPRYR